MYRYVFKRVRDTVEYNIRKSFACPKANTKKQQKNDPKDEKQTLAKSQEIQFLPSSNRGGYDEFKNKYNCKHPNNCSNFLQAITWSTALIAGFYASQLICLYRRNHRLDPKKCFYTQYLCLKNQQFHKKFIFTQHDLKKKRLSSESTQQKELKVQKEPPIQNTAVKKLYQDGNATEKFNIHIFDKLFERRFQKFYDDLNFDQQRQVFNVNNERENTKNFNVKLSHETPTNFDVGEQFNQLEKIIGEIELQIGIECIKQGAFEEAVEHFKMSTNSNNILGCYNLALLFEHGLGVEKDMQMAKRLYQLAAKWGHKEALYNLGVFFAQGLGGTRKSFHQARLCFEKAAKLGDSASITALKMLRSSSQRKFSSEPEDFIDADSGSFESTDKRKISLIG